MRPTRRRACRFRPRTSAAGLVGGYQYLSDDQPRMWTADKNNFQPRLGFTYRLNEPMVLRGGIGLFAAPFQVTGVPGLSNPINQFGYARNTLFPVSARQRADVPGEPDQPAAVRRSCCSRSGRASASRPTSAAVPAPSSSTSARTRSTGATASASSGSCRPNLLVEISYLGQKGQNLPIVMPFNYVRRGVPHAERRSATRRPRRSSRRRSPIPFQGLFPDNPGVNGATIARRRLLLQAPQFDTLNVETLRRARTRITGWSSAPTSASRAGSWS